MRPEVGVLEAAERDLSDLATPLEHASGITGDPALNRFSSDMQRYVQSRTCSHAPAMRPCLATCVCRVPRPITQTSTVLDGGCLPSNPAVPVLLGE